MADGGLKAMSVEELQGRERELRETLARLHMKRHARRLEKPSELHTAKKDLARVLTVLSEKRIATARGRGAK
jgi:large subunit ribosomal protein L29